MIRSDTRRVPGAGTSASGEGDIQGTTVAKVTTPSADSDIRCAEQLSLLSAWTRSAAEVGVPRIKQFPVNDLARAVERMLFCDLHATGDEVGLFVRFQGPLLLRMYGVEFTGCYLDDALPSPGRNQMLATLRSAASSTRPAFQRIRLVTATSSEVCLDVLALPFRRRLLRIEMVVALVTLFSDQPFEVSEFRNWRSARA